MSKFLAVDTSAAYLTVIAVNGEKKIKRFLPDCALNHSVMLMGEIDKALTAANITPSDCDFFAAVTGPGSFTGIRIGISAIKGFAAATGKRCFGVTAFELAAYNINDKQDFLVARDALHENYYACGYRGGEVFLPPSYLTKEKVLSYGLPIYGFEPCPLENFVLLNAGECLESAVTACAERGENGLGALYIRKSQAEENSASGGRKC